MVEGGGTTSVLLWGPPGSGKTTLARLLAAGRRFVELSAVTAGVKDVRAAIDEAKDRLGLGGERTVLFVDEVHRFNKAQQDALLPGVESGLVTFVGATTENPFFSVISPLLSRSLLLTLEPLTDADIAELVTRAVSDERGLGGSLTLSEEAREHLLRIAGGDARRALTALEAAAGAAADARAEVIDLATLEQAVNQAAVRYDREGDQHYDVTSAFIKSMRGGDVDASLHYLARMIEAGEDPRFIARRLVILASEDVGLADPQALPIAVAAAQAVQLIGLPEGRLVRQGDAGPVPPQLRDAHYPGARRLQHGKGYRYPHDFPDAVVQQQYAPDAVHGRDYYDPSDRGAERVMAQRLAIMRAALRGVGVADTDERERPS